MSERDPLLIRNALVATLDGDNTVHDRADVLVEGGAIAAVGQIDPACVPAVAYVIEAEGKMVVPGFGNAHTHSPGA